VRDTRIRFDTRSAFFNDLNARVDAWIERDGVTVRDAPSMYLKTAAILAWWLVPYVAFLVIEPTWLGTLALAVVMGGGLAGIGMSVMHDGGHKAYSNSKRVNAAMAWMLDVMGASSHIWHHKHNVRHHTYPNVSGSDDDIEIGFVARLAPASPRMWHHRWQHIYMWPTYGLISIKWHLFDDFYQLARGRIGDHAFPRPKGRAAVLFWLGKATFFGWALVLPLVVMPVEFALAFYLVSQFVEGLILAVTFQLAHCVEEASYLSPPAGEAPLRIDFARHQLATTIDFAPDNRFATWYLGGLNFQAVHHLFPRICHVHYPAISRLIAETCADHGVPYAPAPSIRAALGSHYRWLKALGRGDAVTAPARPPEMTAAVG
jgi:linoleoyl-CoA desaturase